MKRIISHWTAGSYTPSSLDKEHYHFLIDGNGEIHNGLHSVEDNLSTSDGSYAAHTRGINSDSIGVAICAMAGATERPFSVGQFPITQKQWSSYINLLAKLCLKYDIPVMPNTVLSHAEVEKVLGVRQRGKWDISVRPFTNSYCDPYTVGDDIRKLVKKELEEDNNNNNTDKHVPFLISSHHKLMPRTIDDCGLYYMSKTTGAPEVCSTLVRTLLNSWLDSLKSTSKESILSSNEQDLVRLFQVEHDLDDDGVIGPDTFKVLKTYGS